MIFNKIRVVFLWAGYLLFFSSSNLFAQDTAEPGSSFYQQALANTIAIYHHSFGNQSALYNGSKYGGYPFRMQEGQPFFNSTQPAVGSVSYDGILYDSVLMQYDEIIDRLLINDQANWIQLLTKKVDHFNLFNSDFIPLEMDSTNTNLVSSGFYNLLYSGKISLLKKQIKSIREVISSGLELQRFVDTKDYYYLQKDNRLFQIKSRKEFYKILGNRKKEMQQFIKANKLNFRKDRQNMLTKLTAYYDSLN